MRRAITPGTLAEPRLDPASHWGRGRGTTHVSEAAHVNVNKTSVLQQNLMHNEDNGNHIITVILSQTA